MKYTTVLYAPDLYWKLEEKEKAEICNGCGPRDFGWLVPDTLWGLNVSEAADIHDFMYYNGKTLVDKTRADEIFLNNMVRIIEKETKWNWLRKLRCMRAQKYFWAVHRFGEPAFWADKS